MGMGMGFLSEVMKIVLYNSYNPDVSGESCAFEIKK